MGRHGKLVAIHYKAQGSEILEEDAYDGRYGDRSLSLVKFSLH